MAKAKKKQLSELAHQKQNQQNKKQLNPFEVHINRDKQNVLGRKNKSDKGLPGISRTKAINKRKKTLLQEFKLKNKDNVFLDKRIGEKNVSMSEEEKAMARFAAERIKAHKKNNIFNLNEDEVLTHKGQTLEEIEKFDDPKSDDEFSDDENKTGKLQDRFVEEAHFGGGTLSRAESGKSRKDLIEQLIAESKKRKAEKQKIREQTIDLTQKLDSEWRDLLPIVTASNAKMEEVQEKEKLRPDDYDVAVRALKFEARGMPSDKLKSEEETVREEKEKLEALEADRLARMKGFIKDSENEIRHKSVEDLDDGFAVESIGDETMEEREEELSESDEEDVTNNTDEENDTNGESVNENDENNTVEEANVNSDKDNSIKKGKNSETDKGKITVRTDYDTINSNIKEKGEIKTVENEVEYEAAEDNESTKSESSTEDNLSDLKESEASSEDEAVLSKKKVTFKKNNATPIKQANGVNDKELKSILKLERNDVKVCTENDQEKQQRIRDDLLKRKEIMEKARKELPYTYKVPESFEDLQKLLQNYNPEYQSVIVDRIIKCNHWTLDGRNKEKLTNLLLYLLQHLNNCAVGDSVDNIVNCFNVFDRLSPYLYDLAHVNPESTKVYFQEIIKEKHEEFEKNKKNYPGLDTLIFLKLVSLIFPTSDFRHPVVTPCFIFMSQMLLRCRIKSRIDMSKGLFICSLILEYTVSSKRFAPSAINFLRGVIYTATPKHLIQGIRMIPPFKTIGELSNILVLDGDQSNADINPIGIRMKAADLVCEDLEDEYKIRTLLTAVNMLNEFKNNFDELEAVYSIFEPIYKLLKSNKFDKYPPEARKHIKKLKKDLRELSARELKYLVLEKKRPKPLRMYEPKIEAVYDGKKHKPMSKEKAEREKLLHKYKKEMKGAIREIRRDRSFLAKVQIKQQIKSDAERKRKVKEIFGEAAMQQSELKKLKRKN